MHELMNDGHDYFQDNAPLLDALNKHILDFVSESPDVAVTFDLTRDESDTLINRDLLSSSHIAAAVQRLVTLAKSEQPVGAVFGATRYIDPVTNQVTLLESSVLIGADESPLALRSVITRYQDDALAITSVGHVNSEAVEAHHRLLDVSEIIQLVDAYITKPELKASLLSLLYYHTPEDDIDHLINDIRFRQEAEPTALEENIIDEVRAHLLKEGEVQKFIHQLGTDHPEPSQLQELIAHY